MLLNILDPEAKVYRNMSIKLLTANQGGYKQEWWKVNEECGDYNYEHFLDKIVHHNCADYIILYCFNDKVFPPTLSFITAGG